MLGKDIFLKTLKKKKYEHYDVSEIGFKYNMIDINAAMGIAQLNKIQKHWKIRQSLFSLYKKKLVGLPLIFQKIDFKNVKHAYHLFLMVIDKKKTEKKRDDLISFLFKNKIGVGINYRTVTDMTVYRKKYGWTNNTCPYSKYLGDNTLSIPVHPKVTKKEALYICEKIKQFFQK